MGPVFLLDVSIVILVISPASSKLDWLFSLHEVSQQVIVQEFGAIVTVESFQIKRESLFDVFYLLENISFSFAPYSSLLSPSGSDINAVDGECKHPSHRVAAVSNRIGLQKSGA